MEYDLHNSVLQVVAFKTQVIGTDTTTVGSIIDTNTDGGFESIEFVVQSGTVTTGDFGVILEDSDVVTFGGEEAVIDSELVLGTLPVAETGDDLAIRIGTITKKRFVRLSIVSDNTASLTIGATAVLSNARTRPTPAVITP